MEIVIKLRIQRTESFGLEVEVFSFILAEA
jgi:hypothetical protein